MSSWFPEIRYGSDTVADNEDVWCYRTDTDIWKVGGKVDKPIETKGSWELDHPPNRETFEMLDRKDATIERQQKLIDDLEMTFKAHLKNYSRKKRKQMIKYYGTRMFK